MRLFDMFKKEKSARCFWDTKGMRPLSATIPTFAYVMILRDEEVDEFEAYLRWTNEARDCQKREYFSVETFFEPSERNHRLVDLISDSDLLSRTRRKSFSYVSSNAEGKRLEELRLLQEVYGYVPLFDYDRTELRNLKEALSPEEYELFSHEWWLEDYYFGKSIQMIAVIPDMIPDREHSEIERIVSSCRFHVPLVAINPTSGGQIVGLGELTKSESTRRYDDWARARTSTRQYLGNIHPIACEWTRGLFVDKKVTKHSPANVCRSSISVLAGGSSRLALEWL